VNDKELYEALDTVWSKLPDDATQQEFTEVVRELVHGYWKPSITITGRRWLGVVDRA